MTIPLVNLRRQNEESDLIVQKLVAGFSVSFALGNDASSCPVTEDRLVPLTTVVHHALADEHRPCLSVDGEVWSYGRIVAAAAELTERLSAVDHTRIGVCCREAPGFLSALLALHLLGRDAILLPAGVPAPDAAHLAGELGATCCICDRADDEKACSTLGMHTVRFAHEPPSAGQRPTELPTGQAGGRVLVPTSGTSGRPKAAMHRWPSLAAAVQYSPRLRQARWLLTYPLSAFAGLQVLLQSVLNGAFLAMPPRRHNGRYDTVIGDEMITHVSGTPTFWHQLLIETTRRQRSHWQLAQITLGGEVVPQPLLNLLRREFPGAKITQIYASTEMGVCLSVHDGQAGFPRSWLDHPPPGVELAIEQGELLVRSSRAMEGYAHDPRSTGGWFATGDLVEARGDRVQFLGRRDDTINVGGYKVVPLVVEQCIGEIPGVREVRVCGQRSSISGRLVRAQIVANAGVDLGQLRTQVVKQCRRKLASYKVPRMIDFVDDLAVTPAGKISRA